MSPVGWLTLHLTRMGLITPPAPTPRFVDNLDTELKIQHRLEQIRARRTRFTETFERVDAAHRWTPR